MLLPSLRLLLCLPCEEQRDAKASGAGARDGEDEDEEGQGAGWEGDMGARGFFGRERAAAEPCEN